MEEHIFVNTLILRENVNAKPHAMEWAMEDTD
jgi:hypothetical protein